MSLRKAILLILLITAAVTTVVWADDPENPDDQTVTPSQPDFLLYRDHGQLRFIVEDGSRKIDRYVGQNDFSLERTLCGTTLEYQIWNGSDYITLKLEQWLDGTVRAECSVDSCPATYVHRFKSFDDAMRSEPGRVLWPLLAQLDQDLPTVEDLRGMMVRRHCTDQERDEARAIIRQVDVADPLSRRAAMRKLRPLRFVLAEAVGRLDLSIEQRRVVDVLTQTHLHGDGELLMRVWDELELGQ